jgi:SAM-dependent methyltransferase
MKPADYDAWYDSPRGKWIGNREYRLLSKELALQPTERLLDVGCGTGWFTRRFSAWPGIEVAGVDICADSLAFARSRDLRSSYLQADALALPFSDNSFDRVVSVAALCFTANWQQAVAEIVRVSRKSFAIALLNRHSLLWREKREKSDSSYQGAVWLSPRELRDSVRNLAVSNVRMSSAIFLPSGSLIARTAEQLLPASLLLGGFILLAGDKATG